jgi:RNA polymerase sigma factor (sigma-70 family)
MAQNRLSLLLSHVRDLAATPADPAPSDRELLAQFATQHDEAAFAMVVRRHGPMVFRVCRRVLCHEQDAEDAFQATFLVLARKARSVSWQLSVANWLHKAAYHVALRAKAAAARRRAHEAQPCSRASDDALDNLTARELLGVLDEELTALPERYRAPLVLCYLEGATRDEAGRQLGCPLGTLKSRLERARESLRRRLARRGISLGAALAAAEIGASATAAAVPPAFLEATVRAALSFVTGTAWAPPLAPRVLALAKSALPAIGTSWKVILALFFMVVGLATAATGLLFHRPVEALRPSQEVSNDPDTLAEPLQHASGDTPGEATKTKGDASAFLSHNGKIIAQWSRDGTLRFIEFVDSVHEGRSASRPVERRKLSLPGARLFTLAFLPDGKSLAVVAGNTGEFYLWDFLSTAQAPPMTARQSEQRTSTERGPGKETYSSFAVSRDGKTLAGGLARSAGGTQKIRLWDASAGRQLHQLKSVRQFALQESGICWLAFAADSKKLASASEDGTLCVWEVATGKELRRLKGSPVSPDTPLPIALAPDGRTLAQALPDHTIQSWDVDSGNRLHQLRGHQGAITALAFFPAGKRLVSASRGDRTIRYWDLIEGLQTASEPADGEDELDAVARSADGTILLATESNHLCRWELHRGFTYRWGLGGKDAEGRPGSGSAAHHFPPGRFVLGGLARPARGQDVARIDKPFTLHPNQYILSGGPRPTDPMEVDDDLEISCGKRLLFIDDDGHASGDARHTKECTFDGSPIILVIPPGAKFRLRVVDRFPDGASVSDVYMHRWDGARKRLVTARWQHSNPVLPHTFFDQEFDCALPVVAAPAAPDAELGPGQLDALWADLASDDAARRYLALWALAAAPRQAVPYLCKRIQRVAPVDVRVRERMAKLITDLDSNAFAVREAATNELEKLADLAEPFFRKALEGDISPEARRRLEHLLKKTKGTDLSAEQRRQLQALEALEHCGTAEARRLLEDLARGAPQAWLTRRAAETLERLSEDGPHRP